MLTFSFSSVLISILCCNALIIFLSLVFSSHKILLRLGFRTLNMILLIVFLRLLFPFELPVTTNIYFPERLSYVIAMILGDNYSFHGFSFSIWNVMVLIWITGFFCQLYRYADAAKKLLRFIRLFGTEATKEEPYASILKQICSRERCRNKIHIIKNSFSPEPAVYYLGDYYILIPDNLEINANEMRCLLSHEVSHILHHDLLIKNLVQIACMLYWWNPFCILFKKQLDLLLELQADQKTGNGTKKEKDEYLSCLVRVANQMVKRKTQNNLIGLSFTTESGILLKKRVQILMENDSTKKRNKSRLVLLPVYMLVVFSLLFIFEPYGISPEDAKGSIELTAENCYAIESDNGTYNIYYNNNYFENVNSLEYYPDGMIIYYNNGNTRKHRN